VFEEMDEVSENLPTLSGMSVLLESVVDDGVNCHSKSVLEVRKFEFEWDQTWAWPPVTDNRCQGGAVGLPLVNQEWIRSDYSVRIGSPSAYIAGGFQ
jgi:hypothetical protein